MRPPSSPWSLLVGLLVLLTTGCSPSVRPLAPPEPRPSRAAPARRATVRPPPISLTASDGSGLLLATVDARAVVEDPLALTELELSFDNPHSSAVEGRFEILLPPGARVTRFALWQSGQWQEAEVVERQYARQAYEAVLHEGRDPALLEQDTGNRFRARVFPIQPRERKRVLVSYTEELADPEKPYRLLARDLPWLERLEVDVVLEDPAGGPPHHEQRRIVGQPPGRDVIVPRHAAPSGGVRRDDRVVARVEPLAGADPGPAEAIEHLTVLLDGSASRALDYDDSVEQLGRVLHALSAGASTAQLELLVFDQGVETIYEGPLGGLGHGTLATLHARRPLGATDLHGALQSVVDGERDRLLLVTDGLVSAGSSSDAELARTLRRLAGRGLERVDVIALGHVRDEARLRRLATALPNGGVVLDGDAPPEESARRILHPTLDGVRIDVPGASWWHPRKLDGLQPGDFVVVHAELPAERESMRIRVNGPLHVEHEIELRDGGSPLVEHAWMHGRVTSLVERVETLQDALESERLRALAVSLSVRHRILNDLTAMLVLDGDEDYARFGLDRRAPADVLVVGPVGARLEHRGPDPEPRPAPEPTPEPEKDTTEPEPEPEDGGSISGVVTNSETDERIGNALVILQCSCLQGTRETMTNASGLYRFAGLPHGTYTVQVLVGQADVSKITTLPPGARFRANFSVDPEQTFMRTIRVQTRAEARRSRRQDRREAKQTRGPTSDEDQWAPPPTRPVETPPAAPPPPRPPPAVTTPPTPETTVPLGNVPLGNSTGRDFTMVVESSATVSRDSAGISLAGTTAAESVYHVDGANISSASYGSGPTYAEVLIKHTTVDGDGLTRRAARRHLGYRSSVLDDCYQEALLRDEQLWGRVRVELHLDRTGRVTRVGKLRQINLDDEQLLRCVERALEDSTLGDGSGRRARIRATLVFAPFDGARPGYVPTPRDTEPPKPTADQRWTEIEQALTRGHLTHAAARAWAWHDDAPADVLALLAVGTVARARGNRRLAARAFGSILDLHPSQAPMRRLAASRLSTLDDPEARDLALDALEQARSQRPDHPSGHRALAMALLRDDRPREAFEALAAGLTQRYPPGRAEAAAIVLREDLGIVAAAWLAASPTDAPLVEDRLRELGATRATEPSLRFVVSWETDASDVDLWVQDGEGTQIGPDSVVLPTGGRFLADVTNGFGPEAFVIPGKAAAPPYQLYAQYYDRGPMGYGMGELQIVRHDGEGGVMIESRPFVLMGDGGMVDLGLVWPDPEPTVARRSP